MSGLRTFDEAYRHLIGRGPESPERLRAAQLAAERSEHLRANGWTCRAWCPTSRDSPATIRRWKGYPREWDATLTHGWLDHPYRVVNKASGRTVFVAEPYALYDDALVGLAQLVQQGWSVEILPEMALHFPGWTIAIWIERQKAPAELIATNSGPTAWRDGEEPTDE
jgi:hypothetical protein